MTRDTPEVGTPLTRAVEEAKLRVLICDLVWAATDGGCKLKPTEYQFSHFDEPIREYTELMDYIAEKMKEAHTLGIQEGRELERAEQSIAYKKSGV